jgi:hypothetical protein
MMPSDLTAELGKLRQLLTESEGSPALQRSLIDSIRGCAAEYDKQQVRNGRMLSREAVMRFVTDFVNVVNDALDVLPTGQRETIVDDILGRLPALLDASQNRPDEVRAIIGREVR